jgi:hypothetical protein
MRKLQISVRDIMSIAIQQEIFRCEEPRQDHRLDGFLLVGSVLSSYGVGERCQN